ncbi:hypothetical protein A3K93_06350 [Acinetobacter sp. NCu2D-2]|uniref:hypothetical protein n=1 Tax=Acinetobacter sp. NCu2D-2 TaxID=1608473 RepID=UPI0007CDF5A0|nr:hypothetical protein [Acinetobacter sp. NCu2D-2]ANF81846.1 hypothetical protein A3K93_06350 [Acinetobacter sp. NCu2D-2]
MTRTLDGIQFDTPPTAGQIIALAQKHSQNIHDAIFEKDVHLGNFTIAQRIEVYHFTRQLDVEQRAQFYKVYNDELARLAEKDPEHPEHAETGVSVFAIAVVLAVICLILYFTVIRTMIY